MFQDLNDTRYENEYNDVIKLYQNHMNEIGSLQDTNTGQWH